MQEIMEPSTSVNEKIRLARPLVSLYFPASTVDIGNPPPSFWHLAAYGNTPGTCRQIPLVLRACMATSLRDWLSRSWTSYTYQDNHSSTLSGSHFWSLGRVVNLTVGVCSIQLPRSLFQFIHYKYSCQPYQYSD